MKTQPPGLFPSLVCSFAATSVHRQTHRMTWVAVRVLGGQSVATGRRPKLTWVPASRGSSPTSHVAVLPYSLGGPGSSSFVAPHPGYCPHLQGPPPRPLQPLKAPPQPVLTSAPAPLAKGSPLAAWRLGTLSFWASLCPATAGVILARNKRQLGTGSSRLAQRTWLGDLPVHLAPGHLTT